MAALNRSDRLAITAAIRAFEDPHRQHLLRQSALNLMTALRDDPTLGPFVHFIKYRVKSSESLRQKLTNKAIARRKQGRDPDVVAENLFSKIGDLAAVRILHLHTDQIEQMAAAIGNVFSSYKYKVKEGPKAIVWDEEYEALYKSLDIATEARGSMYMSVHYVVEAATTPRILVELQVRTLMEEVWGEIDHRIRYKSPNVTRACRDQLKVLARMTSGCTRLVDSIVKSGGEE